MRRPQPPRRPTPAPAGDLSPSCHVLTAQHTAALVFDRLHARWPSVTFRVRVCDRTLTAGPAGDEGHPLKGLSVDWSDGPLVPDVEEVLDYFRGVERDDTPARLRQREALLATATRHVVLVHYRVGYLTYRRRLSASYQRQLRALHTVLREHGQQLLREHEHHGISSGQPVDCGGQHLSRAADAAVHPPQSRRLPGPWALTASEARLLRLPGATWTPWGVHCGPVSDLLELLARHVGPEAAAALRDVPAPVQVALLAL